MRLHKSITADYQVVRDNFIWRDHVLRLLMTAGAIAWLKPETVMDPACGDASIVKAAHKLSPIREAYLGDISVPQISALWGHDFGFVTELWAGDALEFMAKHPKCDVVVLTEILEHVLDPNELLRRARTAGAYLVMSTPLNESPNVGNHEHLWSWDAPDIRDMLSVAGWNPIAYTEIRFSQPGFPYTFQLWVCE